MEYIKILRRKIDGGSVKGIIKFKFAINFGQVIISPDIIDKIELKSGNRKYEIESKDIYYDSDSYVTAYIDNLDENIDDVIIKNSFGGKMEVKNIMNIQGSGETRQMLKDSVEKLFFIPFFKLIEIFYDSLHDKEKYEKLKKENFGNNFEDIIILGTFKKQIEVIDKLLFASRPDILGGYENLFLQNIIGNNLNDKQMEYFKNKLKAYYQ